MKNGIQKRRKPIEIYFVLYLAALIFLLPDKKKEDIPARTQQPPFQLITEKTALVAKLKKENNKTDIVSIDSTNMIYFRGDVKDVDIEIIIEDQTLRESLVLRDGEDVLNGLFRFDLFENEKYARFIWSPKNASLLNKTYLVRVRGRARTGDNIPVEVNTQFSLNTFYPDEMPVLVDNYGGGEQAGTGETQVVTPIFQAQPNTGPIQLSPAANPVFALALEQWSNRVFVFGTNPVTELLKEPELSVSRSDRDNGGTAEIAGYTDNSILLKGKTPSYGTMKVSISLTRKNDGRKASLDFEVRPQQRKTPSYDKVMYPEVAYKIDPNMPPDITQSKAQIRDAAVTREISGEGGVFYFTPSVRDTGKTLYLERYVGDKLLDRFPIYVAGYKHPEIYDVDKEDESGFTVRTKSFGGTSSRKNYVSLIKIAGEIQIRELPGKSRMENGIYFQTFEIRSASGRSFSVQAVDQKGLRSAIFESK